MNVYSTIRMFVICNIWSNVYITILTLLSGSISMLYGFSPVSLYLHKWAGIYFTILMVLWGSILMLALSVEMFIALYSIYMVSSSFNLLDF